MSGILSPSLLNLFNGKAFVLFQRNGLDAANVHLGKLTKITYTPKVEVAEYYDQSQGIAILADTFIQSLAGEGDIILNEATVYNLSLLFQSTPNYTTVTAPQFQMYGLQSPITGPLTIVSTNGKGPRYQWNMTNAQLYPSKELDLISEKYATITLSFKHLADANSTYGTTVQLPDVNTIAPTSWTAPFITSPVAGGGTPAGGTPAYGSHSTTPPTTYTLNGGQWTAGLGASYAYQWYRNTSNTNIGGSSISGATGLTYTAQAADAGDYLYATVIATNPIGATTATSQPTLAVL
jgi:hypothetical protein